MTDSKKGKYWNLFLIPMIFLMVWLGLKWYRQPGVSAGNLAPDFTASMPDGKDFTLSSLQGKWVLVDFWGSWCGPCRQANRNLVKLYDQYHGKKFKDADGFEIVSVGIETNRDNWLNAIRADGLDWPYHVSSMKRLRDPVALQYGIREIPTTILLGPKGNILAVNMDFNQLNGMLAAALVK